MRETLLVVGVIVTLIALPALKVAANSDSTILKIITATAVAVGILATFGAFGYPS